MAAKYQVASVTVTSSTDAPPASPIYRVAEVSASAATTANVKVWDGTTIQAGRVRLWDGTQVVSL